MIGHKLQTTPGQRVHADQGSNRRKVSSLADSDPSGASRVPIQSLAKQIQAEVDAAEHDARSAIEHAAKAGALLLEAKASVKHGEWGAWISDNFAFSQQWAASLMRLAQADPKEIESAGSIRGALKQIGPPKKVQRTSWEAIDRRFSETAPRREDFDSNGPLAEAVFLLACERHAEERTMELYRQTLAVANELVQEDAVQGAAMVSKAATGLRFYELYHRQSEEEGSVDFLVIQEAWMQHRAAQDACLKAFGRPGKDERQLDMFDVFFHPQFEDWRNQIEEDDR